MSLPTFSELMASLQLTSTGEPETGAEGLPSTVESPSSAPSTPPRSRSLSPTAACQHPPSTTESPSIVVSQFDTSHTTRPSSPRGPKSLGRSNRFAPYLGATNNIHHRRSSMPDVPADVSECDVPDRPSSASPRMHPNTLRDVSMNAARPARSHKVVDIDTQSDVPISSFVRRRTPQSSPTASTFSHRRRSGSSQDSLSPVLLPTLLPGLTGPSSPNATELMDVPEMDDMRLSHALDQPKPRNRHQGLRLSSYRATSQQYDEKVMPSV